MIIHTHFAKVTLSVSYMDLPYSCDLAFTGMTVHFHKLSERFLDIFVKSMIFALILPSFMLPTICSEHSDTDKSF